MKPARTPSRTALAAALSCTLASGAASAQVAPVPPPGASPVAAVTREPSTPAPKEKPGALATASEAVKKWFEKIKIGGYTQLRYNQLGATNERLVNLQGDRSIGKDGGFFFRRARLVIQGDVHERVFIYLQPDFATIVADQLHAPTMRDWYADIALDEDKEFRFRVGQSKVPFGFENMQSSSNRAPLDRADATNASFKDERELGVFYYYAPKHVRRMYKEFANAEMKGSGDYGVVGLGIFNGQGANKLEKNATPHAVARVTYPFRIGGQIIEPGVAAYYGRYVVKADEGIEVREDYRDMRVMGSLVVYPQPIGLQLEYNIGRGPELSGDRVVERPLHGGYATVTARIGKFTPYVRFSRYRGGRKFEDNAPRYKVDEVELGVEWRPIKALELVGAYTFAERTFPEPPYQQESGRLVRLQLQFNY